MKRKRGIYLSIVDRCSELTETNNRETNILSSFNAWKILTVDILALWVDGVSINYVVLVGYRCNSNTPISVTLIYSFFLLEKAKKQKKKQNLFQFAPQLAEEESTFSRFSFILPFVPF